jgi:hypothetical protein
VDTTKSRNPDGTPKLNSEKGRAFALMLYAIGFPEHRIGSLFDADHGRVSQVLNSTDHKIS